MEAQSADCLEQEQLIEQIKVDIELMDHMPTVFYIQGMHERNAHAANESRVNYIRRSLQRRTSLGLVHIV